MKSKISKIFIYILSFFIPFFVTLLVFKNNEFYPFTNNGNTILLIDAQGQYIAFYRYYKAILSGDKSLIYTLGKALGGDMMSLFTYYLASPFYLLFVFTKEANLPSMLLFITILKIATSGLTSYIFIKKIVKNELFALLLSISYSLISYNFIYHSNLMWLDGVYLLPLVLLGAYKIVKRENPILYIISLALTLYTSWYIGYMVCIFVVFFYLIELFKNYDINKENRKNILKSLGTFAICSLLGGFISAFSWMSAFLHLNGTKGSVDLQANVFSKIKECFYGLNIFRFLTINSFEGAVNINNSDPLKYGIGIYVGSIAITFLMIYFINKNISIKKRLLSLIPLSILLIGFISIGVDNLWHGGSAPTWFPFRYAFIFGLYAIFLAGQTIDDIDNIHPLRLLIPLSVFVVLTLISSKAYKISEGYYAYTPSSFSFIAFAFILLMVTLNYYFKKQKWLKPLTAGVFVLFTTYNMYLNSNDIITKLSTSYGLSYNTYKNDEELSSIINSIKEKDSSFYRLEKTFMRDGSYNGANNDSMYYGYNGLSHYSSNEKKDVQEYLCRLGFHYNYFWEKYGSGSTISINSFLGVKYILTKAPNSYDQLKNATRANSFVSFINQNYEISNEETRVYENPYVLPLMVVVNDANTISEGTRLEEGIHWYDHFEYQNQIYKTMTSSIKDENGIQKDIFNKANYRIHTNNEYTDTINGKVYKELKENDFISYSIDTNSNYPFYYNFKNNNNYLDYFRNKLSFNIDSSWIAYFSYYNSGINGFPIKNATQNITVKAKTTLKNQSIIEEFYYEDLAVLEEYINSIKSQEVKEIDVKDSSYKYEVNVTKDNQIALLTIPYEENFKVFVDGKKVKSKKAYNIFIGVDVPKGKHTVEVKYVDKGIKLGSILSGLSIVTLVGYVIFEEIRKHKKTIEK